MMRAPSPFRRRGGFTLVELLVVIGLAIMLFAIAVPAFRGMTRGSGVETAITTLRTTMSLARQHAITQHKDTHVVFPDIAMVRAAGADFDKALRAYAVYTVEDGYISDWKYLPSGVLFARTSADSNLINNNKSVFFTTDPGSLPQVKFPTAYESAKPAWAISYTPSGNLKQDQHKEIYLMEGSLMYNNETRTIDAQPIWTSTNLWSVEINRFTGVAHKINDYSNFIR